MKKIIYWFSTVIVAAMMFLSAFEYLTNEAMKNAFVHLGFPDFFRIELAIAKILGAIVLLIPFIPYSIRQFAYFGFALTFISAFIAHLSVGDAFQSTIMPIIFLGILLVSYFNNKANHINLG